jgi:ketosteroid isomerase-like protein
VKVNTADGVPILNFFSDDVVAVPPPATKKEGLSTLREYTLAPGKL